MGGSFALLCTMDRHQLIPPPKVRKNRGENCAHLGTLKRHQWQTRILPLTRHHSHEPATAHEKPRANAGVCTVSLVRESGIHSDVG